MGAKKFETMGVKAVSAFNLQREDRFLDPSYSAKAPERAKVTKTGLLEILRIEPEPPDRLPSFSVRWDQKKNTIDVDRIGNRRLGKLFKRGAKGYKGHHPITVSASPRTFRIEIVDKGHRIYEAQLTLNVGFAVQIKDAMQMSASVSASCEAVPKAK